MKIVAMGGGTGLSALLHGLKKYVRDEWNDEWNDERDNERDNATPFPETPLRPEPARLSDLTAVVTVSDDGGSSGRLRREFQVLPPGDIRNCMVALSEDEGLLSRLFQFRFPSGKGLKGHSFGNLFLTALTGITGDFQDAVKVTSEVLAIRGRILPSTVSNVTLEAVMQNGRIVRGETLISRSRARIARIRLVPARCHPLPQTLEAIDEADAITVGPGSLFTSLIPNLLVQGVAERMARAPAARIFICNLMSQPGETIGYSAADHIRAIYDHCGLPVFDYALLNTNPASPGLRRRYLSQRSKPVEVDAAELEKLGVRLVTGNLLSEERTGASTAQKVRHHSDRLAKKVLEIALRHRNLARKAGGVPSRLGAGRLLKKRRLARS
ncbi:MAG: uridine diphosphate-N-acetylglucosamine-binding protein YvcK [Acidobacteria bacterium]|nr:uridine diphosphate-N-acetylglucosamine-binding protein YvcK [Acidobacteriota bacterium]